MKAIVTLLLLICLFDMPYGYYQLVRYITAGLFCWFVFEANEKEEKEKMFLFIIIAVLFQPIFKIPLGRVIWNIVDVLIAGYLIYDLRKEMMNK
mgnify:CR=1 FL=1